ncbi:MAG: hypothetical protein Q9208_000553 [Pyrenodesmia sp. 3 TL-2023]
MRRTLLLCFIHGFKGDSNTFSNFPEHLRALVSHALPRLNVKAVTYPQFETRGDLSSCVTRFREWFVLETIPVRPPFASGHANIWRRLQNVVIDLEVSAGTPSPTVDPSVRTILIGHSMGGIVAAETLLHIISDEPIPATKSPDDLAPSTATHTSSSSTSTTLPQTSFSSHTSTGTSEPPTFLFPYIQGVLAFDTPYLGLSPSLIAHGAESHYRSASSAYTAISDIAGTFGWGASDKTPPIWRQQQKAALPAAPEHAKDALSASMTASSGDAAATPTWQRLGKYAMFAGAAGAVAAGGAAAYIKKDALSSGWNWVSSHLEFVGTLARGEELKQRHERVIALDKERGIGFADLYTVLGKAAPKINGETRTFCNVPKTKRNREHWYPEVNDKARDETGAHMAMFTPKENPGYYGMGERAKELVVKWVANGWHGSEGSGGDNGNTSHENFNEGLGGIGGLEDVDIDRDGDVDFGVEKEEGVLWGDGVKEDNPWKMEGEKGLEGVESVLVERR